METGTTLSTYSCQKPLILGIATGDIDRKPFTSTRCRIQSTIILIATTDLDSRNLKGTYKTWTGRKFEGRNCTSRLRLLVLLFHERGIWKTAIFNSAFQFLGWIAFFFLPRLFLPQYLGIGCLSICWGIFTSDIQRDCKHRASSFIFIVSAVAKEGSRTLTSFIEAISSRF